MYCIIGAFATADQTSVSAPKLISGSHLSLLAVNMGWRSHERIRCVLVLSRSAAKYGIGRIPGNAGRNKVIASTFDFKRR